MLSCVREKARKNLGTSARNGLKEKELLHFAIRIQNLARLGKRARTFIEKNLGISMINKKKE